MKNRKNKKKTEYFQKDSNLIKKLMDDEEFLNEISNIRNCGEIIRKFDSYGVDLKKVNFDDLCNIFFKRLRISHIDLNVNSLDNPISVDYRTNKIKTVINVKDQ